MISVWDKENFADDVQNSKSCRQLVQRPLNYIQLGHVQICAVDEERLWCDASFFRSLKSEIVRLILE